MKKIFTALLLEIQSTLDYQQPPSSSSHTTTTETTRKSKLTYIIYYMKTRSNIQERDPITSEWGVTRIAQELPRSSYYARFLAILANPDSDAFPLMRSGRCIIQEKRKEKALMEPIAKERGELSQERRSQYKCMGSDKNRSRISYSSYITNPDSDEYTLCGSYRNTKKRGEESPR